MIGSNPMYMHLLCVTASVFCICMSVSQFEDVGTRHQGLLVTHGACSSANTSPVFIASRRPAQSVRTFALWLLPDPADSSVLLQQWMCCAAERPAVAVQRVCRMLVAQLWSWRALYHLLDQRGWGRRWREHGPHLSPPGVLATAAVEPCDAHQPYTHAELGTKTLLSD